MFVDIQNLWRKYGLQGLLPVCLFNRQIRGKHAHQRRIQTAGIVDQFLCLGQVRHQVNAALFQKRFEPGMLIGMKA